MTFLWRISSKNTFIYSLNTLVIISGLLAALWPRKMLLRISEWLALQVIVMKKEKLPNTLTIERASM